MSIVLNGSSGITTPGISSSAASSFSADVTLAGSGVELLNNSGRIIVGQSGSVIQVVQGTTTTQTSTTSTSYVATTLSASITPSSTSSKILVLITTSYLQGQPNYGAFFTVLKNGSDLIGSTGFGNWYNNSGVYRSGVTLSYLDSPATTASTTYALGIKSESASYTVQTPSQSGGLGVITLMEIAA